MNHIKTTYFNNGYVRLVPDDGYIIEDIRTGKHHSVAMISKNHRMYFIAVKNTETIYEF